MRTLPLSEVKMKLSALLDEVGERSEPISITRNGRPAAVLVSVEEFESWQETLSIQADRELMEEIRRGLKDLGRTRRLYTLKELLGAGS
ncbi:MAG: type II toxin-antitoxin system Phd/YefM family antitoxin [Deltaproteobacteria bacterium]|nr:type II toxin-antitoxin system Phd/YefM family antitoxin [Deltaproteobacteria bacterium]